ncbi:polymorphic toxin-type HINT domain-containing protein [Acetivibrio saccincola]|uniref:polymorphic toxin-type HINT domain-containing protein n=1 Tax=Acetivibrio saccincola TaxID=1677857 RepID=UPI00241F8A27|nr:polymorphic toxin-type HINT domain-containing protein [Acetivibrio saccincola]
MEVFDKPVKVYNFEVEDWHTYYVTEQGVLVHNAKNYDGNGNTGVGNKGTRSTVDDFIKANVNPNFQQNVKNAFTSDAKATTLTKDLTVYRYHGGTSSGKSYWYTPNLTSNPAADLALPAGNTYQYVDTYIIPKGTTILEGTVAPNFGQPGGGYQIYVPNPTVVIPK